MRSRARRWLAVPVSLHDPLVANVLSLEQLYDGTCSAEGKLEAAAYLRGLRSQARRLAWLRVGIVFLGVLVTVLSALAVILWVRDGVTGVLS